MNENCAEQSYEGVYEIVHDTPSRGLSHFCSGQIQRESDLPSNVDDLVREGSVRLVGFVRRQARLA
ncbi:MAG: hypothetical protein SFX74_12115 [Fimbriimonadaceae bacterium]|nr:hypothetical protein [Fimbriimonadaceae bacterium]